MTTQEINMLDTADDLLESIRSRLPNNLTFDPHQAYEWVRRELIATGHTKAACVVNFDTFGQYARMLAIEALSNPDVFDDNDQRTRLYRLIVIAG